MTACLRCAISRLARSAPYSTVLLRNSEVSGVFRYLGPSSVGVELAGAERDDVAGQVADRPHQPAAEPVPGAAVALPGQARRDQLAVGEAPAAQVPGQVLPGLRRVADAEPLDVGELEAALGQEGAGRRGVGAAQPFGVELGGGPVRVDQPAPLALFLARDVTALLVAELDAGPRGQPLDRLDEARPSIFCTNLMTSPPSAQRKQ